MLKGSRARVFKANPMVFRSFVLLVFCLSLVPAAQAGTVEGEVKVEVRKRAARSRGPAGRYGSARRPDSGRDSEVNESRNVVISVPDLKSGQRPPSTATIEQSGKEFQPHVTVIRAGDTIKFPNGDKVYHSVYSESPALVFHLPEYPKGESRSKTFDKPGHVELFCAIHSHMNAHILIMDNDFFSQPDEKGRFRIENLPPGKHQIRAWHPKLGAQTKLVEVPKEGVVKVTFDLQ